MEVSIATSVKYGNYKQFYSKALSFDELIAEYGEKIRKVINLPEKIDILLRPIQKLHGQAYYIKNEYGIEVNVRQTIAEFKDTLLHELIHIEQFFEGRLANEEKSGKLIWRGKSYHIDISNLEAYNNLPWEQEAIRRAYNLGKYLF